MKILVLTKRQYTGKDLLDDRYGRLFEIPACLAQLGHEVHGIAMSYRKRPSGNYEWPDTPGVKWYSFNAFPTNIIGYHKKTLEILDKWSPDIIWASSDMLNIILATKLARKQKIPIVIDLYDNYESFGMSRLPGLTNTFRNSCRTADYTTVITSTLADFVASKYRVAEKVCVIGNGVRFDLFHPREKKKCRKALGLPLDAKIIGGAGSTTHSRGVSDLFEAFLLLARDREDLWLVYAGITDYTPEQYQHPRIVNLGVLPFHEVPELICSLDTAVICNRNSNFGKYCFPLKLQEAIACRVPIVAAAVGDVASLLSDRPDCLYLPGNFEQLATRIAHQLEYPKPILSHVVSSWHESAVNIESLFKKITESQR